MSDLEIFRTTLAETIAWCGERLSLADPSASLRSIELRPRASKVFESRESAIQHVARERSWLLHDRRPFPAFTNGAVGKLLVYEPDMNLADGAAQVASAGFFDVDNIPPWDTWLGHLRRAAATHRPAGEQAGDTEELWCPAERSFLLISWVPTQFLELAGKGIWANPEQCINWAVDVEHDFFQELRQADLMS